jgi:hypothetical protein
VELDRRQGPPGSGNPMGGKLMDHFLPELARTDDCQTVV